MTIITIFFYHKPSNWFGWTFSIVYMIQIHFFQHINRFILTEAWCVLFFLFVVMLYPKLKINSQGIFLTTFFGLINYKKIWAKDITDINLRNQKKVMFSTSNYFRLVFRNKTEATIDLKLCNYLKTEEIITLLNNQYGLSLDYKKDKQLENAYEIKILILGGMMCFLAFALLKIWGSDSMMHINTNDIFFWHKSVWFFVFLLAVFILIPYKLEKKSNDEFRNEKSNLITLAMFNFVVIPLTGIPNLVELYNEKNITQPQYRQVKLIENKYQQIWMPLDFDITDKQFSISKSTDKNFYNGKLKKGKTYLIPLHKGKYNDYFFSKGAFKEAKLVDD